MSHKSPKSKYDNPSRGYVADQGVAERMRRFLARHGESAAAQHFGLNKMSIARCAAGLQLQASTMRSIRDGLEREPAEVSR